MEVWDHANKNCQLLVWKAKESTEIGPEQGIWNELDQQKVNMMTR